MSATVLRLFGQAIGCNKRRIASCVAWQRGVLRNTAPYEAYIGSRSGRTASSLTSNKALAVRQLAGGSGTGAAENLCRARPCAARGGVVGISAVAVIREAAGNGGGSSGNTKDSRKSGSMKSKGERRGGGGGGGSQGAAAGSGAGAGAFDVDVVSEESFYDNLTLGLPKLLGKVHGVRCIQLEKRPPCDLRQLSQWERRHHVALPTDLRRFYASADGFRLSWAFQMAEETVPVGRICVNSLSQLERVGGGGGGEKGRGLSGPSLADVQLCQRADDQNYASAGCNGKMGGSRPDFSRRCKAFDLDACEGGGRVCLVYTDGPHASAKHGSHSSGRARAAPSIWLLDRALEWHFLAPCFTQYFRMLLKHHGLPEWHFRFTSLGLSPWAEQWYVLVAPHLLKKAGRRGRRKAERLPLPRVRLEADIFKEN